MPVKKKLPSLRNTVLITVGAILLAFTMLFYFIFQASVTNMLGSTEAAYFEDRLRTAEVMYKSYTSGTFALSKNEVFHNSVLTCLDNIERGIVSPFSDWSNNPDVQQTHKYDLIALSGPDGEAVFSEFRNQKRGEEVPRSLEEAIGSIAKNVLERAAADGVGSIDAPCGILLSEGEPYFICTVPVEIPGEDRLIALTFGNALTDDFFRNLTYIEDAEFQIVYTSELSPEETSSAYIADGRTAVSHLFLGRSSVDGRAFSLRMSAERPSYGEELQYISIAIAVFLLCALILTFAIYFVISTQVLRPLEKISGDIAQVSEMGDVAIGRYSDKKEYDILRASINSMLKRLRESNVSLGVLSGVLNGIDCCLYASDARDGSLLFMNDQLKKSLGIERDVTGEKCYDVMHGLGSGRCADCPVYRLYGADGAQLEWEAGDDACCGKHTSRLIRWSDSQTAHLHLWTDITGLKTAERSLRTRLGQQELMAKLSQSFISQADMQSLVTGALQMTGEFLDAGKILLSIVDMERGAIDVGYSWYNDNMDVVRMEVKEFLFDETNSLYRAFITENKPYLSYDDISGLDEFSSYSAKGVKSFISLPVHASGVLWGILSIDMCDHAYTWNESDIYFVKLIANVIGGVVERDRTGGMLRRMSAISESSPHFVFYVDPLGCFEYVNPGAEDLTGYSREDLLDNDIGMLFDESTADYVRGSVLPAVLDKGGLEFELPLLTKLGEMKTVMFSAFATFIDTSGIGVIAWDVTENRLLEMEMLSAKELAEISSQAKSDFLSRMSHEMRTPMNAIIGMTYIAKASHDPDKKEYCLDKIDEASKHLLGVINDILDMSKIESGKFELSYTDFDFQKMLLRVTDVISFKVDERNQNLIVDLDPDVPEHVISDEQRLSQIITNLLSNAVKFTPESGAVTLRVKYEAANDSDFTLTVSVSDTGIGISPEQQIRLFTSFEQADGSISRRFGGTGLGLAICKNIVSLMGGDIWVDSEKGSGSTFTFSVPARKGVGDKKHRRLDDARWRDLNVLVVDDSAEVREYFRTLSAAVGFNCDVAADGLEAEALLSEGGQRSFNIIFVDWKMPGMNGIELTRRIKERSGDNTVVIMISAAEWQDVENEASDAGVDRFLAKPLFSSLIIDCITECVAGPSPTPKRREEKPSEDGVGRFTGRRMLLAEDIEINREIVITLLEDSGISIRTAEDGLEAYNMFAADPEAYDIIFMDIHMPEVDGYESTRRIRELPGNWSRLVPIVAMTANVFREDIEKCLEAGMNDHIGKPVDAAGIYAMLEKYL